MSGDIANVKAETGVEVATDDWIQLTSSNLIDINCDTHIMLVADAADTDVAKAQKAVQAQAPAGVSTAGLASPGPKPSPGRRK